MNSCRDPESEVFDTWLPGLPWDINISRRTGNECKWKVTQEVSMGLASGSVLYFCPPSIGQHIVTWLHGAAGHAGKCSPPSCSGGRPSLCSTFLHHEGVRLGLGQGPHQPGESESSLHSARDWARWGQSELPCWAAPPWGKPARAGAGK